MIRPACCLGLVFGIACSGPAVPSTDAGPQIDGGAVSDAGSSELDGGGTDASILSMDAGTMVDAGQCPCMSSTLDWNSTGGTGSTRTSYSVEACATYRRVLTSFTGATVECTSTIACEPALIGIAEILAALGDADVVSAFESGPPMYGCDDRAVDGFVLHIRFNGGEIQIGTRCEGGPCAGGGTCVPIPEGVSQLADLLGSISNQQDSSCL